MNILKKILLCSSGIWINSLDSKTIFYHDVAKDITYTDMTISLQLFQKHLEVIARRGFHVVTEISNAEREIQICFDDGFRGIWDCRDYILQQNWRPTVFIAVDLIGQPGYLTKDEILSLSANGVLFQSHTWSHNVLTDFHGKELEHEIKDSKTYLENMLGTSINELCFPRGIFSDEVLRCCQESGYTKLYSSIPGNYFDPVFPQVIRRNLVQFYSPSEVSSVIKGGLGMFDGRYKKLHYHQS